MLDEDERLLEEQEEDNYYIGVDNYYDYWYNNVKDKENLCLN
jgi:hypothetical protein